MPQMMPMLWMLMLIFTLSMLLMIIILIYFLNLPLISQHQTLKKINKIYWIWEW
uniref:ATP synthase F0 subunit 8 n=1 Tax=Pheidole fervens TaxID=614969 RepID=UPI00257C369B|nr:ATP synthase F0 subunit 8 [Pheidole fervens]WGV34043.1 ATP synthase F0 subunit 8 [Pheidole fervens]